MRALQRRSFSLPGVPGSFQRQRATLDVRQEPQPSGGCHCPNYAGDTKLPAILCSDIDGAYAIPVIGPTTPLIGAGKHAALWRAFAPLPTGWK
jgi:hypothetical protein